MRRQCSLSICCVLGKFLAIQGRLFCPRLFTVGKTDNKTSCYYTLMAWDEGTYREVFPKFMVPVLHLLEEQS